MHGLIEAYELPVEFIEPHEATDDELVLYHDADYIECLMNGVEDDDDADE